MRQIHRDIVGTFIFSSDDQILLGKSRQGGVYPDFWLVPGGGVEDGETNLEAARRETLEEVGIDIAGFDVQPIPDEHVGCSEKVLRDTGERVWVDMCFHDFTAHADKPASEINISCEDDIAEASWHPIAGLSKLSLAPPTKASLTRLGLIHE